MRRADRAVVAVGRERVCLTTPAGAILTVAGEDLAAWWRAFDGVGALGGAPLPEGADRRQDRLVVPVGTVRRGEAGTWAIGLAEAAEAAQRATRVGVPSATVARALVEALADQLATWCRAAQAVDPARTRWEGDDVVRDPRFRDRLRLPAGADGQTGGEDGGMNTVEALRLDGRRVAQGVRSRVAARVRDRAGAGLSVPSLAVVLVGDDPPSHAYVRGKAKACREVGIHSTTLALPAAASTDEVVRTVERLNEDPGVHGILVQLPLPPQVDSERVVRAIRPDKDVDGLHPENLGRLLRGQPRFVPCTPRGVMTLLDHYEVGIKGRRAVVVGRSTLVGLPLAILLMQRDASVTILHAKSVEPWVHTREADLVVSAVGRPGLLDRKWIRPGAVVVDVGITRTADGLVGDVAPEVQGIARAITPVPGGVGPMTIATLLQNTVAAAEASD